MKAIAVLAALLLAACAGEEGSLRDAGGANIGKPQWTEIYPAQRRLRLPPGFPWVEKATRGSLPDRTVEVLKLEGGGYVQLELSGNAAYADDIPDSRFRALFKSIEKKDGSDDGIILEPKRSYPTIYAEFTIGGKPCLVFRRPIGSAVPNVRGTASAHEGSVTGLYCDASGQADFTARALDHIRQIRLW